MLATVTFYRGHHRTLCCLPGIISLIIMCIRIIFRQLLFCRRTCLTGPQLRLNSRPRPLRMSCSTAHGAQVIRPLDYMGRLCKHSNIPWMCFSHQHFHTFMTSDRTLSLRPTSFTNLSYHRLPASGLIPWSGLYVWTVFFWASRGFFVFSFFITLFLFGSVWQIKLAIRQLLDTHKYSLSYRIVSLLGEKLATPSIGNTLWRVWMVFTRSAITPPKVNRFGWNLGHSEYIVCCWLWQILGAIYAAARASEPKFCFFLVR